MKLSATSFLLGLTVLTLPLLAFASESLTASGSVSAEREYDSSVSLDQVDDISRESDYASKLKWALGGKWQVNDNLQLSTSYKGRQRIYDQFSEYDLEQHQLALSSKFTYAGIGYSYRYDGVTVQVDGDDFLNFNQSTLAVDKLFDSSFLRGYVSKNKKDFMQLEERNASATIVGLDSLVFYNQGKSHLSFNISMENETAQEKLFDNKTGNVSMAYQHKFTEALLPTTWTNTVRYGYKRYDSFIISTVVAEEEEEEEVFPIDLQPKDTTDNESKNNEKRVDGRTQFTTRLDIELNDWLGVRVEASYINNDSNYAPVDYSERLMSVGINASF
jgi:hypothetical protein